MIYDILQVVELHPGQLKLSKQGSMYLLECWTEGLVFRGVTDSEDLAQRLFVQFREWRLQQQALRH